MGRNSHSSNRLDVDQELVDPSVSSSSLPSEVSYEKQPPPADHGKDAYLFLISCFILEAMVWGLPFCYGVFNDYYSTHGPFQGTGSLAAVGTCCLGILYLDLPFVFAVLQAYPKHIRFACCLGVFLMGLALALSSFANKVWHLILTQGILFGIGGSISYSTCLILISDWYHERKGIAFAIMLGGTGLGGTVLPIVTEQLLKAYGFRTTLRGLAIAIVVLSGPFCYYMKPRTPTTTASLRSQINVKFFKTISFIILQTSNTIQGLGFFLPSLYLPMYARELGASQSVGALTVVAYNIASIIGCVLMGLVIDKWHITTCLMWCTVGSTIAVFCIWGVSMSLGPLFVFAVAYGIFAGAWVASWPGMIKSVQRSEPSADASTVLAWISTGRGLGSVISGPLSEELLKIDPWKGADALGYGSGYGVLIVFVGVTSVLTGGSFIGRRFGWIK